MKTLTRLPLTLLLSGLALLSPARGLAATEPEVVDFRYAPPWWQTCIGLPDDWQKTLVGKDGSLLYDYPGRFADFALKITIDTADGAQWVGQELLSPRVPLVRTHKRSGSIQIEEEAFAIVPSASAKGRAEPAPGAIERVGDATSQTGWASPTIECDPAFRNVAVGWGKPVDYRIKTRPGEHYSVVLGLCEGWHTNAAQRVLDLQLEGRTRQTVDLVAAKGRNVPQLFAFTAQDENGDGWIDVTVAAAKGSPDQNTILNLVWVFEGDAPPATSELLRGRSPRPALAHLDGSASTGPTRPSRSDLLVVRFKNTGPAPSTASPVLRVETEQNVSGRTGSDRLDIGDRTRLRASAPVGAIEQAGATTLIRFVPRELPAGGEFVLTLCATRGGAATEALPDPKRAGLQRRAAVRYWRKADLPYDRIEVPDDGVQALIDSAIRNIYQAREIKQGLPAFQVGPTCYRGLWVVDGSFLMEAVACLGRTEEARKGIQYLMSFQRADGGFMLIDGHWKETGIVLWAVTRHARLTGDRAWLESIWPAIEKGFAYIRSMREMAARDPGAPNYRLIPAGFSDGGLGEMKAEYTNPYWTMAGMRAAVEAARWLGKETEATDWQRDYDDFLATFRKAAERDARTDQHGNRYIPIRMQDGAGIAPQRAQWAFCHAVFPGQVFAADDPLVVGNMKMLEATEREGMVFGTGWIADGIWNYFASFYGHAWLWLGRGDKSGAALYAFANHASPLLCWREEQMPKGVGTRQVGDMPHNWASAEFIRLVRHSLVLERGTELHLGEGLPSVWLVPGKAIRLRHIETDFGPMSLEWRTAPDGRSTTLSLDPPQRTTPSRIVLHLDRWSARSGVVELKGPGRIVERIALPTPR